jgi:hypothetical protein
MPDFAAIKARQQQTWATGDYAMIGHHVMLVMNCSVRPLTSAPASGCSTWPPEEALDVTPGRARGLELSCVEGGAEGITVHAAPNRLHP